MPNRSIGLLQTLHSAECEQFERPVAGFQCLIGQSVCRPMSLEADLTAMPQEVSMPDRSIGLQTRSLSPARRGSLPTPSFNAWSVNRSADKSVVNHGSMKMAIQFQCLIGQSVCRRDC